MKSSARFFNTAGSIRLATLAVLGMIALPALATADVSLNVNIGGPGIVWQHRPAVILVPGTQVSWVRDYSDADVYQDGDSWYCYRGGNWYSAPDYSGPWMLMNVDLVPQQIVYIPVSYHHFDHQGGRDGRGGQGGHPGVRHEQAAPVPVRHDVRGNAGNSGRRGTTVQSSTTGRHGYSGQAGNSRRHSTTGDPSHRSGTPAQPRNPGSPGRGGNPGNPGQPGSPGRPNQPAKPSGNPGEHRNGTPGSNGVEAGH